MALIAPSYLIPPDYPMPEPDSFGSPYAVIECFSVDAFGYEVSDVLVLKTEVGLFYVWQGQQGLIGRSRDTHDMARRHARDHARSYGAHLRSMLRAEFMAEQYNLLWAMRDSEIIAEAKAHRKDGAAWRNLRNPLLLRPDHARSTGLQVPGSSFNGAVRSWIGERPWRVDPVWLNARTVKAHRTYKRLKMCVLDFDEAHQAFEFKLRWL